MYTNKKDAVKPVPLVFKHTVYGLCRLNAICSKVTDSQEKNCGSICTLPEFIAYRFTLIHFVILGRFLVSKVACLYNKIK